MAHTPTSPSPTHFIAESIAPHRVEFLYIEDCPSHERALEMLKDAMREEGISAEIFMCRLESDDEVEALRFAGSPTIRVDGKDIDESPSLSVGLSCRAFRHPDGRISPLPPRDKVVSAIRRASRAG